MLSLQVLKKKVIMKKTILFCFLIGLMLTGFCQKPKSDFVLDKKMYELYSQAEIDKMYDADFAQLFRMNFKMCNFAVLSTKYPEDANVLSYLEHYAKPGVVVNEEEIIRNGVNPFDFNFPQDENRVNVVRLHTSGYYLIIHSKQSYDAMVEANLQQFEY